MQKWEYAVLTWWRGNNENVAPIYLRPEGPQSKVVQREGIFAKEPDYWTQLASWITKLGLDGWEMTGVVGDWPRYQYWFKCPKTEVRTE